MSDGNRGWNTGTSAARTFETYVDRCSRCRADIVTRQSRDGKRRRYALCCDCTADVVSDAQRRRAAAGEHRG